MLVPNNGLLMAIGVSSFSVSALERDPVNSTIDLRLGFLGGYLELGLNLCRCAPINIQEGADCIVLMVTLGGPLACPRLGWLLRFLPGSTVWWTGTHGDTFNPAFEGRMGVFGP